MLFNSLVFLVFFVLFFLVWTWAKKEDLRRWVCMLVFSFVFYAWWDWRFLFLILFSGLVDYGAALKMQSQPAQKRFWLIASLLANIGSLAIFKYSKFIAQTIDALALEFGLEWELYSHLPAFSLIVPVGISFYTFQSMSYTIDVYKGKLRPTQNIAHFFAYLSMFPQLVAGPIIRAKDMLQQLAEDRRVSAVEVWLGLRLMVYGFFQKMVLADNLAPIVNQSFWDNNTQPSCMYWWMVMLAFSFQIYFDFAGYSSIARGLAKLMGYRFKSNFNHPYHAISLRDFWSRWHISLSTWFRDYVYIPLGGTRGAKWKGYRNMWITMLISGLWHGPALNFILWGAVHAACLSVERLTKWPTYLHQFRAGRGLAFLLVLVQVVVAWVFFRATSFEQAIRIVGHLFSTNLEGTHLIVERYFDTLVFLGLAISVEGWYYLKRSHKRLRLATKNIVYDSFSMALLITACVYFRGPASEFIYFQF
ncbi:MAG: Probable poly(beta-D-mannuronate) O-acetylase (EC [uncultured Aureispira sp.]|uniref:Probable poly(Beta-D-mannuronate) O-acetylase (EC) n=1 Tax=uncultured Aureispira sp. TaxID=1331704 RepID=A0A6S6S703_9BACT|nr:MAG: Probable poly(beta-D-mannuronate) O-acetylase (EC [uncultured Aureispira sp.]